MPAHLSLRPEKPESGPPSCVMVRIGGSEEIKKRRGVSSPRSWSGPFVYLCLGQDKTRQVPKGKDGWMSDKHILVHIYL